MEDVKVLRKLVEQIIRALSNSAPGGAHASKEDLVDFIILEKACLVHQVASLKGLASLY